MKNLKVTLLLLVFWNVGCAQTSLKIAQGVWKEEVEAFKSYIVIENHTWYSITILEGSIDVSKEFFGFYNDFEADSIQLSDLAENGKYLVFLTPRNSIKDYRTYLKRSYFNFFEYDLDNDYFIYYGNDPVRLNKIEALPKDIQKVFDKKKAELDHIKFLE